MDSAKSYILQIAKKYLLFMTNCITKVIISFFAVTEGCQKMSTTARKCDAFCNAPPSCYMVVIKYICPSFWISCAL